LRELIDDKPDDALSDEMKPEHRGLRYWPFFNGEQTRLFAALAAGISGVAWCFLYVLGIASNARFVLLVSIVVCGSAWALLDKQIREYERSGWQKDRRSPKLQKIELKVAIYLWLFILLSVCAIFLPSWRHTP
jgi:hypothetical protein